MALEPDERKQFKAGMTCRASWNVLDKIKTRLKGNAMIAFKNSCFGHFMSVEKIQFQAQLYLHLLFRQDSTNSTEKIVYHINGHESVFGPKEFCLITGLNFGNLPSYLTTSSFHKKIFDGKSPIHVSDIEYAFDHVCDKYNGDSEWCLKVALLYFLQGILVARGKTTKKIDLNHLHILDDIDKFNLHPWGRVAFDYLISDIRRFQARFVGFKKRKLKNKEHSVEKFDANGFPYAIQVWVYEMMPAIGEKYGAPILDKMNAFPCLLRYKALKTSSFEGLKKEFFRPSSHIEVRARMKPTSEEKKLPWYISYEAWRTGAKQSQIQNMTNKRTRDAEESNELAIHRESRSKKTREEHSGASEKSEIQDGAKMEQFNKRTRDAEESDEEAIHLESRSKKTREEHSGASEKSEIQDGAKMEQFNKRTRDAEESDEEAIHLESKSKRREEPSRASEKSEIQDGAMTEQFKNLEKRMTKMFEERMSKIEEKLETKIDKVIDGLQMVLQEMKQKPKSDPTNEREHESPQLSHLLQCPALDYLLQVQHITFIFSNDWLENCICTITI